jgi:hypothetical protein
LLSTKSVIAFVFMGAVIAGMAILSLARQKTVR